MRGTGAFQFALLAVPGLFNAGRSRRHYRGWHSRRKAVLVVCVISPKPFGASEGNGRDRQVGNGSFLGQGYGRGCTSECDDRNIASRDAKDASAPMSQYDSKE